MAGRLFSAAEEHEPLALISFRLWMQRFGGGSREPSAGRLRWMARDTQSAA